MARTPLMRLLRRAIAQADHDASRRTFIKTSAMAAAAVATPALLQSCGKISSVKVDRTVKVAVVGAGLAGLHATWLLKKANVNVELYEGSKRIGGRAFTGNNVVVEGGTAELGGEWLDVSHSDMFSLAKTFGVGLIDKEAEAEGEEVFFFGGKAYSMDDIVKEIKPYLARIAEDANRLPDSLADLRNSPAKELDDLSLEDYMTKIGLSGWLRSLFDVAYLTEFGLETSELSALSLITLIVTDIKDPDDPYVQFFGDGAEKYVLRGGVQGITRGLAKDVEACTMTNHVLTELNQDGERYILTFNRDSETVKVAAEHVVLAIPFTILRDVTLNVDLPEIKRRVIKELAYGTNGKVLMGFKERFWEANNYSGGVLTELPLQLVWENCHVRNPNGSGLTMFYGGKMASVIKGMSDDELRTEFMKHLHAVWKFPDTVTPTRLYRMHWPDQPFVKASYSCIGKGQWSVFYGVAGAPAGRLHFAGEHCSLNHQGYLNGGAETGRLAAERILKTL